MISPRLSIDDLLGFSRDVEEHWGHGADSPAVRLLRIKEAVAKAAGFRFGAYIDGKQADYLYSALTRTLSDSFVLAVAIPENCDQFETFVALASLETQIRISTTVALGEGYVCRGAIEFGSMAWNESEFIGPCFNAAYRLESKLASSSRIIYGPSLLRFMLNNFKQFEGLGYRHELIVCGDGLIARTPAGLFNALKPQPTDDEVLQRVRGLRANALDRGGARLARKYTELIEFLEAPTAAKHTPTDDAIAFAIGTLERNLAQAR